MTDTDQLNEVNQELVDEVVSRIPKHTWDDVKATLITHIVDSMPSEVLINLTDDPEGFEKAEEFLYGYYEDPKRYQALIKDAFQIFGEEYVLVLLDSMQLDKISNANNECLLP